MSSRRAQRIDCREINVQGSVQRDRSLFEPLVQMFPRLGARRCSASPSTNPDFKSWCGDSRESLVSMADVLIELTPVSSNQGASCGAGQMGRQATNNVVLTAADELLSPLVSRPSCR